MTHENDSFRLEKIVRTFKYFSLFALYFYNKVKLFLVKIDLGKKLYKSVNFRHILECALRDVPSTKIF